MQIDLKSLDENGKTYTFDELSEEIQGAFVDLIGDSSFKIDIELRPMGHTYKVDGTITSQYIDVCSRCAYDVEVPLNGKINEIVVIEKPRPRNTVVSQTQQNFDSSGPAVTYINEPSIDLKDFLHEMMAASLNLYPACADKQKCDEQQFKQEKEEDEVKKVGHPGFEALRNLKTKH